MKAENEPEDNVNYSFILECMAGLAVALTIAGTIALIVLKATPVVGLIAVSSASFFPVLPFFAMGAIVLAFGFLAALMTGGCYAATAPQSYSSSFWTQPCADEVNYHSHVDSSFDGPKVVHHHPSHTHDHPSTQSPVNVHNHPGVTGYNYSYY